MRHVTPEELTRIGEDLAREQRERELERERERLSELIAARVLAAHALLDYDALDPMYVRRDAEAGRAGSRPLGQE